VTELLVYLFFLFLIECFSVALHILSMVRHSTLWRRLVIRNVMSLAARKFTKTPIFGLKVVQGHWCWYHWKARRQCLLW